MQTFKRDAPSGVSVTSNVPFVEPRWWDRPALHIFWSYSSWITMVLATRGWSAPRKMFNKYMTR